MAPRHRLADGDQMARHGARVLAMLPSYGVFNEVSMPELRRAICAWLGVEISDDQAHDARGWQAFIAPHIP